MPGIAASKRSVSSSRIENLFSLRRLFKIADVKDGGLAFGQGECTCSFAVANRARPGIIEDAADDGARQNAVFPLDIDLISAAARRPRTLPCGHAFGSAGKRSMRPGRLKSSIVSTICGMPPLPSVLKIRPSGSCEVMRLGYMDRLTAMTFNRP